MRTIVLALALACVAAAAEVKLPAEVKVKPGRLTKVEAVASDPKPIRWVNVHEDLDVIESETGRWAVVSSPTPGRYRVAAYSDAGGPPSYVVIVVEGTPPKPPPGPEPKPDDPPAPKPVDGPLRVLIVYESAALAKMPEKQQQVIFGRKVRDWLNAKCAPDPDGKTKSWRIWDADTDASGDGKQWQDAIKRPRASVPFLHVFRGDKPVHEGPLPDDPDAALMLLDRIEGGK